MKLKKQVYHTIPKKESHYYVQYLLFMKPIYNLTTIQSIATCQGHDNNIDNDDNEDDNEWSQINHIYAHKSIDDDHVVQYYLEIDEYTKIITRRKSKNTKKKYHLYQLMIYFVKRNYRNLCRKLLGPT
jgi:hypothetical protein